MGRGGRYCYADVLPFAAMVTAECTNVGLNTLFKAATLHGMSCRVFVPYAYGVAALLLLPSPFFSRRSRTLPSLNFSVAFKIALLGIIGCASQIMGYEGINYSSPTLASAISNLIPAFTFILAVIFRMEKLAIRSWSSKAKILGTVVSISGALVVTLYRGTRIIILKPKPKPLPPLSQFHNLGITSQSNWVIGSIFLTTDYLLVPIWYIVQAQIMKEYPAELTVLFFYNLTVSVLAAIVGLFMEPDLNKWRIRFNITLVSILCSGIVGSGITTAVQTWAVRLKGPVYVAMFKPLSIAIAVAMGVVFLGDTLYLGSLVGAAIISIGFYSLMWGKAKENSSDENEISDLETSQRVPLLTNLKIQDA